MPKGKEVTYEVGLVFTRLVAGSSDWILTQKVRALNKLKLDSTQDYSTVCGRKWLQSKCKPFELI